MAVPGTRWLIASAFGGEGGLFAIDTRAASSTKVHPVAAAAARLDKVDPNKWTYTTIVDYPTSPAIAAATVAIQVGDELWAGSFRGDRIARYPARGLR